MYAKSSKNGITYASPGAGTPLHLAGELFSKTTGLEMLHVPYKGSAPALNDLLAGRVVVMFDVVSSSVQFAKEGRLRPLAVTSKQRSSQLPGVPSLHEQGVTDFQVTSWFGLFAPANTPAPIVAKLNAALNKAAASPKMKERLVTIAMEPASGTPEELGAFVQAEREKWTKVIRSAGIESN